MHIAVAAAADAYIDVVAAAADRTTSNAVDRVCVFLSPGIKTQPRSRRS